MQLVVTNTSLAAFFTRLAVMCSRTRPRLVNIVHGYLFSEDMPLRKKLLLLAAEKLAALCKALTE